MFFVVSGLLFANPNLKFRDTLENIVLGVLLITFFHNLRAIVVEHRLMMREERMQELINKRVGVEDDSGFKGCLRQAVSDVVTSKANLPSLKSFDSPSIASSTTMATELPESFKSAIDTVTMTRFLKGATDEEFDQVARMAVLLERDLEETSSMSFFSLHPRAMAFRAIAQAFPTLVDYLCVVDSAERGRFIGAFESFLSFKRYSNRPDFLPRIQQFSAESAGGVLHFLFCATPSEIVQFDDAMRCFHHAAQLGGTEEKNPITDPENGGRGGISSSSGSKQPHATSHALSLSQGLPRALTLTPRLRRIQQLIERKPTIQEMFDIGGEAMTSIQTAYRALDLNGDGDISMSELESALARILSREDSATAAKELMERLNCDGESGISLEEFTQLLCYSVEMRGLQVDALKDLALLSNQANGGDGVFHLVLDAATALRENTTDAEV